MDGSSPAWHRRRLRQIDLEGNRRTRILLDDELAAAPTAIEVEASSPGLASARIAIPLSYNAARDAVLAVAARSVTSANLQHDE